MTFRKLLWHPESETLWECFDEAEATHILEAGEVHDVTDDARYESRADPRQVGVTASWRF